MLRLFPTAYHRYVAWRLRKMFRVRFLPNQTKISEMLFGDEGDIRVLSGPFAGMKYMNEVFYSSATPRWLGTYEMELHPAVEEIGRRGYQVIIDVGSAEGYYAVGLARLCPHAKVYAFDTDPWSREQCRRLSQINELSARVNVRGLMKSGDLAPLVADPTLIVCDIEGYELRLLDPQLCSALLGCDLLVEVHEFTAFGGQIEETLTRRFADTHQIRVFTTAERSPATASGLFPSGSPVETITQAMDEHRSAAQSWLWMKQKRDGQKT